MADTPTLREAAQQAMEAIEPVMAYGRFGTRDVEQAELQKAHAALRAALAEQAAEQAEPVAPHLSYPHITQPYTLEEIRAQIASHDYSAELLLQHAMLLLDDAEQAEPVALDVTLTEEETSFLRDTMGADEGEAPDAIRLTVGNGHSGYGLYVSLAEYGNEGSSLLKALAAPPAPARQEPLTESQVDDLIHSRHFDRSYKLHARDETCLHWYLLGLRDCERAHNITAGGEKQ